MDFRVRDSIPNVDSPLSLMPTGYSNNMRMLTNSTHAYRTHCYQREERNLGNFLSAPRDKWVASAYEV